MFQTGRILLLLLLGTVSSYRLAVEQGSDKKNTRVLLVAPPAVGHIIPLLRLGEELVKRGHTVGFCTTKISGVNITEESCKKYGLIYLNAGLDPYTWYVKQLPMNMPHDIDLSACHYTHPLCELQDTVQGVHQ